MQILDLLFGKTKPVIYSEFCDSFGNFEITYPKNWKYDKDIAVVDGQYTNSFQGNDSNFTISVNAKLQEINFKKYAKQELESPTSGICAKATKSKFRGFPAYTREYAYHSNGKEYFGGGILFISNGIIFSINWNAPKSNEQKMKGIFNHMLESLVIDKTTGAGG